MKILSVPGLLVAWICGASVLTTAAWGGERWTTRDQAFSVELHSNRTAGTDVLMAAAKGEVAATVVDSPLIESPVTREYGGLSWLGDVLPRWVEGRYLVFEREERLAVVDAAKKRLILNTTFEALVRAPKGERWIAVKHRPIGRLQEKITPGFRDTVYGIDLAEVIKVYEQKEGEKPVVPFSHLKSLVLLGHAVAYPKWKADGSVEMMVWTGSVTEMFAIDPMDLRLKGKTRVAMPPGDGVVQLPWIAK